ncbi:MAG: hypothetical protein NZ893_02950 [Candidatus Aenigmarchaeota archaeon]|nr:hypothetical protein [Candidatus Aenigmarchaeota archaeon]
MSKTEKFIFLFLVFLLGVVAGYSWRMSHDAKIIDNYKKQIYRQIAQEIQIHKYCPPIVADIQRELSPLSIKENILSLP